MPNKDKVSRNVFSNIETKTLQDLMHKVHDKKVKSREECKSYHNLRIVESIFQFLRVPDSFSLAFSLALATVTVINHETTP